MAGVVAEGDGAAVLVPQPDDLEAGPLAAADPPLEPPGTRSRSQGFRVAAKAEFSVDEPMANSSRFVLPRITAPAAFNFVTMVASKVGT